MKRSDNKTQILEFRGNRDANYIKIGNHPSGENLIFLEVGDCCVVTFRGIVTVEMLSNFLTNVSLNANKNLIDVMKDNMSWDEEVNEKFAIGSRTLSWSETP